MVVGSKGNAFPPIGHMEYLSCSSRKLMLSFPACISRMERLSRNAFEIPTGDCPPCSTDTSFIRRYFSPLSPFNTGSIAYPPGRIGAAASGTPFPNHLLPVLQYNYLLHAHSHFAFSGWVTTALFTGLLYIAQASGYTLSRRYHYQFWLNQLSSFGMLASFIAGGYGTVSIIFSSLSVVFSYWFAFSYWRDARTISWPPALRRAIQFALFYLVLSSLGPYLLAYSMSYAVGNRAFYYNAIYLYLHFQYNGWFTFGVIALLGWWAFRAGAGGGTGRHDIGGHDGGGGATGGSATGGGDTGRRGLEGSRKAQAFVSLLGIACLPAHCLSLLWTNPPAWIWIIAVLSVFLQLAAGVTLILLVARYHRKKPAALPFAVKTTWCLSLAAFGIKLILQALSAVPSLGNLAFGHRSVIIAYLHLVQLGFVTLSLPGFFISQGLLDLHRRTAKAGLTVFTCGVLFNEFVLLVQSFLQLFSRVWTGAGYWLFGAALLLCAGALLLSAAQLKSAHRRIHIAGPAAINQPHR